MARPKNKLPVRTCVDCGCHVPPALGAFVLRRNKEVVICLRCAAQSNAAKAPE